MPQLCVYVDRDLERDVRAYGVEVSKACQASLRRAVRLAERRAIAEGRLVGRTVDGRPILAERRDGAA